MHRVTLTFCLTVGLAFVATTFPRGAASDPMLLVSGLQGASGSSVGPGGALYVTEGASGRTLRVDPRSGEVTMFAGGLPPAVIPGLDGVIDVAFVGSTAYALVTLVGPDVLGTSVVGGSIVLTARIATR